MATGRATVPKHLQGNRGDCFAIAMQSMQWGMNPFAVAQKTHLVSGTLGYEAQLVNAVITARAPVTGRMNYEWFGEWDRIAGRFKEVPAKNNPGEMRIVRDWTIDDEVGLGVRVWATFRGEAEPRELRLLLSQAGVRNSPLWGQDPKQQLAYLAVKRWSRLYCPDVILGVYTPDELEEGAPREPVDMGRAEEVRAAAGATQSKSTSLRDKLASKGAPNAAGPTADDMIAAITSATTAHELKVAIADIEKLPTGADKERVRAAYQAKVRAEKERTQQATTAQAEQTGNGAPELAPYETMLSRIQQCNDVDVLAVIADEARAYPEAERIKLDQAYQDRREILLGA
nr:RecT family recombinase [Burkholderia sp. Ac-20345]